MEKAKFVKQGLYFLFNNGELQYIGKSVSVWGRVDQHRKEFDFDYVWYLPVIGDDNNLRAAESILIDLYQPPQNKQKTSLQRALIPFEEKLQGLIDSEEDGWRELLEGGETGKFVSDWLYLFKYPPPDKHDIESVANYIVKITFRTNLYMALYSYARENPSSFVFSNRGGKVNAKS